MAPKAPAKPKKKASSVFQKEEEDKNEQEQKMQGANMKAKKEKKQKKEKEGNERQTLVQIQTLIKENDVELFKLPDPDQNPERLRPALLTPWGTTDDEPPIGERRFGKNRITFSQCRMSLGDLGCSKCNGGPLPSGSGCTTCRLKLGWVPADSTKKHWVPDTTKIGSAQAENKRCKLTPTAVWPQSSNFRSKATSSSTSQTKALADADGAQH